MKKLVFLSLFLLVGCTSVDTLGDRLGATGDVVLNPEEREVHYYREGNTVHYLRRDCSGKFCIKE